MQMQNKISFGKWEATTLLINLVCTKCFLYYSRVMAEDAGTAAWLLSLYTSLIALILFITQIKLFKIFEGKDILDIAEISGGKPLKVITGLVMVAVLYYLSVSVLREFSEDMKIVSLPITPISYIMIIFIIGVIIGSFLGMETILRYHAIAVPVIAAGYLIILLCVIPNMDSTNLLPVLGNGPELIFGNGFLRVSSFLELMIIYLLPPFLGSYRNVKTVGFTAIGICSVIFILSSLTYSLVFPYPSNLESFLPVYQMARLIQLGRFFQRIEAIFVFIWAMAALIYLAAVFYFMVYTFAKIAGLKYMRPLILPFSIIVYCGAFIPKSLIETTKITSNVFNKYVGIIAFVFFSLVAISAALRKRTKARRSER